MLDDKRQRIDVDAKIAAAETEEEKAAWENQRTRIGKIDFRNGWHVGIYKHACGHWEVLQSPIYVNCDGSPKIVNGHSYTAADADRALREESEKRKCTRCFYATQNKGAVEK